MILVFAIFFKFFYSCEPVSWAKLYCGALGFFTIQRIWIVLGRCLFYDSKRSIGEVLFFNQFYWSEIWSGKWNAWKNLEWFGCWTKVKSGAKREWFFVHTAVFETARNWCVNKFSLSERIFFCSRAAFKSSFFAILLVYEVWLWYCIGFGLVLIGIQSFKQLIWVLCKFGGFWSVLLIFRRNLMYFGLLFCFTALSTICIETRYSRIIRDTNWLQFCCYKTFFQKKNGRKIRNFLTTFFKFLAFFRFFFNGRQFL